MPKAYLMGVISVTDPEMFGEYVQAVAPLIASFGGSYIVRAGESEVLEGAEIDGRIIVFEFPSMAAAKAFWHAPAYKDIIDLRLNSSTSRIVLIEGVEP